MIVPQFKTWVANGESASRVFSVYGKRLDIVNSYKLPSVENPPPESPPSVSMSSSLAMGRDRKWSSGALIECGIIGCFHLHTSSRHSISSRAVSKGGSCTTLLSGLKISVCRRVLCTGRDAYGSCASKRPQQNGRRRGTNYLLRIA